MKDYRNDFEYMKDYEKDLTDLRDRFEQDGVSAPDSLSEDSIFKMIENVPQEQPFAGVAAHDSRSQAETPDGSVQSASAARTPARRRRIRRFTAVAASLLLVLGITAAVQFGRPDPGTAGGGLSAGEDAGAAPDMENTDDFGLIAFKDYDELDAMVASLVPDENYDTYGGDVIYDEEAGSAKGTGNSADLASPAATEESSDTGTGKDAPDHSDTYTQVEGIDEADIVKTDGKYIYFVSNVDNRIRIVSVKDGWTKPVSSIRGDQCGTYIHDLYIRGDQLIVIGEADGDTFSVLHPFERASTLVTVYDISDRTHPEQTRQYAQSGYLLSSRLNGSMLYLVTNDELYYYDKDDCFPCICEGGSWERLPLDDIRCFPEAASASYTVIGALDLDADETDEEAVSTKAILGGSEQLYCSSEALYVTTSFYPDAFGMAGYGTDNTCRTRILKLALDGGAPAYAGTAVVKGWLNDQFSMDDGGGIFKIATTTDRNGQDVNNLYLFDEDMNKTGSLRGFAKDEHIEAVRYIDDKAYVITYEQTDPLFIIDFSDPAAPEITGHVKISGFSTLLIPLADDSLLGIGFSTETTQWGEATDGLKLALFDTTDPAAPAVSDSAAFEDMYSEVQYDHKALLVGPEAAWFAIPYEQSAYDEKTGSYSDKTGVLIFTANDGKIEVKDDISTSEPVRRCLYIEDHLYSILSDDSIESTPLH